MIGKRCNEKSCHFQRGGTDQNVISGVAVESRTVTATWYDVEARDRLSRYGCGVEIERRFGISVALRQEIEKAKEPVD